MIWDALPTAIETVDFLACYGNFLNAVRLRDSLAAGLWPNLQRFRIQPDDLEEFAKDRAVYLDRIDQGYSTQQTLEWFGGETEAEFEDDDYVFPAQQVVDSIQYQFTDPHQSDPPSTYLALVEKATDDIRYLLGKRQVDVGLDSSFFFWRPVFKMVVRAKCGGQKRRRNLEVGPSLWLANIS